MNLCEALIAYTDTVGYRLANPAVAGLCLLSRRCDLRPPSTANFLGRLMGAARSPAESVPKIFSLEPAAEGYLLHQPGAYLSTSTRHSKLAAYPSMRSPERAYCSYHMQPAVHELHRLLHRMAPSASVWPSRRLAAQRPVARLWSSAPSPSSPCRPCTCCAWIGRQKALRHANAEMETRHGAADTERQPLMLAAAATSAAPPGICTGKKKKKTKKKCAGSLCHGLLPAQRLRQPSGQRKRRRSRSRSKLASPGGGCRLLIGLIGLAVLRLLAALPRGADNAPAASLHGNRWTVASTTVGRCGRSGQPPMAIGVRDGTRLW
uniref:Uncharacterized protein n=1 Tax=Macrostomum lignano TaxID=282301 RepID=A0A1I8JMZ6_9PLAT